MARLTIAVTGVTGTIGRGLLPFLEEDPSVARVIGIGAKPWRPADDGFAKVEYRRADVRDRYALRDAIDDADVLVHLAFSLYGVRQSGDELAAINVQGSLNALDAAVAVGAKRFVYTSSAAVYEFGSSRRTRVDEDAPVERETRHFYSRHKAEVEDALLARLGKLPAMGWVFFRPCAVVGPDAVGAGGHSIPGAARDLVAAAMTVASAAGLRAFVPGPPVPLQFVHGRDVGQAIHRAIGSDRSGVVYNLGGDGMVEPHEVPELLGLRRLPIPTAITRGAFKVAARFPYLIPAAGWVRLGTQPLELDASRAKRELGWAPEFSSREALQATRRALAI